MKAKLVENNFKQNRDPLNSLGIGILKYLENKGIRINHIEEFQKNILEKADDYYNAVEYISNTYPALKIIYLGYNNSLGIVNTYRIDRNGWELGIALSESHAQKIVDIHRLYDVKVHDRDEYQYSIINNPEYISVDQILQMKNEIS